MATKPKPRNGTHPVALRSSTLDRLEGTARSIAGIVKEETGRLLGNRRLQAEGAADQFIGSAQKKIGEIKRSFGK